MLNTKKFETILLLPHVKIVCGLKCLCLFAVLIIGSTLPLQAQVVKPNDYGKTYYDSSYAQVCEVFHYLLEYHFITDPKTNKKVFENTITVKDGPYVSYYNNGKLQTTGYYIRNEPDSTWKYYAPNGNLIKTELYRDNTLIP